MPAWLIEALALRGFKPEHVLRWTATPVPGSVRSRGQTAKIKVRVEFTCPPAPFEGGVLSWVKVR